MRRPPTDTIRILSHDEIARLLRQIGDTTGTAPCS